MKSLVSILALFLLYQSTALAEPLKPATDKPTRLPEEQRVIDLYKKAKRAVVFISTRSITGDPLDITAQSADLEGGNGAGVIVDAERKIILTNFHVISDAASIQILLADGKNYPARLVGHDPEYDIAALQLTASPKKITAIPFGNSKSLEVGQKVYAIGNPHGLERTLTSGIVSSLHRTVRNPGNFLMKDLIQTDAAINPGNSGGPLLDIDGRLIGLNTVIVSHSGDSAGIGFAVPVHRVARILPELIATGKVLRPKIGWVLMDTNVGPIVRRVLPGSPAAESGIQPLERSVGDVFAQGYVRNFDEADVLFSVNGRRVHFADEVEKIVQKAKRGQELALVVRTGGRGDLQRTITIKPELR